MSLEPVPVEEFESQKKSQPAENLSYDPKVSRYVKISLIVVAASFSLCLFSMEIFMMAYLVFAFAFFMAVIMPSLKSSSPAPAILNGIILVFFLLIPGISAWTMAGVAVRSTLGLNF